MLEYTADIDGANDRHSTGMLHMAAAQARTEDRPRTSVSRRDFLRVGGLSFAGLSVAERAAMATSREQTDRRSVIFILMTGGASHLDTFDPKPDARAEIRGPLKSASTAIPGVAFSESLPKLAERAKQFSVIRSLHHEAAPIHETGLQLIQTGRLACGDARPPSFGSVISNKLGPRREVAPYVVLPNLLGNTGVHAYRGQTAGTLGTEFDPISNDPVSNEPETNGDETTLQHTVASEAEERRYGQSRFGHLCLQARHLVECGVRCVTVNLFDHLNGNVTWDCHGAKKTSPATLFDYRDTLGPQFDQAVAALLDDLAERGLLDDTLVVATGEFGRTPRVNINGGRDHWPGAWSALLAGGGVQGGQIVGNTDPHGGAPIDRPVTPAELVASVYHSIGIDGPDDNSAEPIRELFGD